jgi:hypothetical protein
MGAAGLLVVNVMSAETRKEPDYFIKQRAGGKRWLALPRKQCSDRESEQETR